MSEAEKPKPEADTPAGIAALSLLLNKKYRSALVALAAVVGFSGVIVSAFLVFNGWVGTTAQAATAEKFLATEHDHARLRESVTDHEERLRAVEASTQGFHDFTIRTGDRLDAFATAQAAQTEMLKTLVQRRNRVAKGDDDGR